MAVERVPFCLPSAIQFFQVWSRLVLNRMSLISFSCRTSLICSYCETRSCDWELGCRPFDQNTSAEQEMQCVLQGHAECERMLD